MPPVKLSLVIPTRERAEFLSVAIRSALRAADTADVPVEVVVSDNASADATAQVIQAFEDPRLISQRSDRRLSMRENFEFALARSSGSHVVFIGDDDAVLPHGLRLLGALVTAHDCDVVKWRVLNYVWPDPQKGTPGHLKVRPHTLTGRLRQIDPATTLADFARARFRSYHEGGMIYHGCVSRRLIERARASGSGPYFRGSSPDVFTSLQALVVSDRPMVHIDLPITLGGASPRSNGASGQLEAMSAQITPQSEFARFIAESAEDPWQCNLPVRCKSLSMITLDCLMSAAKLHGASLGIDGKAWSRVVRADIARFSEPSRSDCLALARDVLGLTLSLPDQSGVAPPTNPPNTRARPASSLTPGRAVLRRGLSRLQFSGGESMSDAGAAAEALDRLLNIETASLQPVSVAQALAHVLHIHARAGRIAR